MTIRLHNSHAGITFQHPVAFWIGTTFVAAGVIAHLPDFLQARNMGHGMSAMPMSALMLAGMAMIVSGIVLTAYGLIPFRDEPGVRRVSSDVHFQAMDGAKLTGQHWGLLFVLGVALIVDVMKPATLGFAVPGMRSEYGLTTAIVALFPMTALAGTTVGSLLWGVIADRIGRRAAILLASVLFMGTSICGFMPSFGWNLFMCFIMGMSAGGMLPIVYALMAESIPAAKRGWLVVLHGGLGTVGGYLAAAGLAALLEPHYTWRILWFAGLPTGLLVLLLNRWIPESPRFLLERGRIDEAEMIMARYGIVLTKAPREEVQAALSPQVASSNRFALLFRRPFIRHTMTVITYGFGWGLVNWGFLTFVPTILRDRGIPAASASKLLLLSAVIAVPATVVVAFLYGVWSSKKTMILYAMLTAFALVAFAIVDPGGAGAGTRWLMPLMIALLIGSGGVIAMLSPYTAEVYPTRLRGSGSGIAAASSKIGGILAPPLAAVLLSTTPGFSLIAIVMALPVAASVGMLFTSGIETQGRPLEAITQPIKPVSAPAELVS